MSLVDHYAEMYATVLKFVAAMPTSWLLYATICYRLDEMFVKLC